MQGVHFHFLLTGSARFTPGGGEFASGLLKYFSDLTIPLEKAPLAGDARLLLRRFSFQVAANPPRRVKLFELFEFELRGVGFYPSSDLFGGKAALSVSGQMVLLEKGDARLLTTDAHQMWCSGPKDKEALPQPTRSRTTRRWSGCSTASANNRANSPTCAPGSRSAAAIT